MTEKSPYTALEQKIEDLELSIQERTVEFEKANAELKQEIAQRKSTANNLKQALSALDLLSVTATEFLELSPDEDIYDLISERLRQVVGRSVVVINAYEKHSNLFHTKSVKGFGKHFDRILGLLGKNPVGMTYELNNSEARRILKNGKLRPGPKGLHELSFGTVPQSICNAIEKLLNVDDIYAVGFSRRGELYGSALIITRRGKEKNDVEGKREVIETFINQAAVALQRIQFQEALRDSESRYRLLTENAFDIIWTLDLDTFRFNYVSPSVLRMRGFTPQEVMEQGLEDTVPSEFLESITKTLAEELARDGEPEVDPKRSRTMVVPQRHKDGSYIWAEATVTFIRDDKGRPKEILGVTRDISERKRAEDKEKELESKLQQTQKMEAIATLAGGIAHQFNNALSTIIGRLELLELDLAGVETKGDIAPVKETAHRLANLTSQLLAYARGGKYRAGIISMSRFVRETLPLLEHTVSPSVHVETDLPPDISPVMADVTQIQMVLSALLFNASEAIEETGRIRISCKELRIDEEAAGGMPGLKPGPYVRLTVMDDGRGMDEETKSRIFEPFFTTKFKGRGLGMAAAYGIIKNHDGRISVESEPDRGTVVNVYLPVTGEKVLETKAETEKSTVLLEDKGTVLLIEDDEMVMDVSRAMLEKLGYQVITARTGREAVDKGTGFEGDIDLALLDIQLPDMEAKRIYRELKASRPGLKVIVYSGYSLEGPAKEILDAGAEAFIQKPFTMAGLSQTIDEIRRS